MAGAYIELELVFGDVFTEARAAYFETQYKLAKGRHLPIGGIPEVGVTDEDWVDVPGVIHVALAEDTTAQVHAMGFIEADGGAPTATGSLRLWDITGAAVVTSSEITFTDDAPTLQTTPNLDLVAGSQYKLQVKISDSAEKAVVYGGSLVTQ